jgi:arylsulfatase A-like enzyme
LFRGLVRDTKAWLNLLSFRDRIYLLSLLGPFTAYDLTLKASTITSLSGEDMLPSILSDTFFTLGYALFWVGLFAATLGGGFLRRVVLVLFHAATMLTVLVTTCTHQYYQETGTTLDYGVVALFLSNPGEILPMFASVSVVAWVLLVVALLYAVLGPSLVTRALERRLKRRLGRGPDRRGSFQAGTAGSFSSFSGPVGLFVLSLGLGSFSVLVGSAPAVSDKSLVLAPLVNLVVTGAEDLGTEEDVGPAVESPAAHARLSPTPHTEKRNVVLVHLESTRAQSVTPYNQELKTMPFLDELAKSSLLAERAYTTVPHSSKASVSANCGVYPHLVTTITEALPEGIPAPCLAALLKEQGYNTVFFQSSTKSFENFQGLVRHFGYEEYYPLESMNEEGFEKTNHFGYEDDMMLEPSEEWLKEHKDKPFVAEYLTGTGHSDYQCLNTHYGSEDFSNEEPLNSYLNCMRLQDIFLKNLIDQYKKLGLYENTIFVFYGDHGEGFGEHGLLGHNNTIYEEGLKVPFLIHAPGWFENGEQVEGLSNHTDLLPTVLEMLGYEVENGEYPGYSLLREPPADRTLRFSCWFEEACLASIRGTEKYIYHYGDQPEEIVDLSKDPLEEHNLAGDYSKKEIDERREALIEWRSSVDAEYGTDNDA